MQAGLNKFINIVTRKIKQDLNSHTKFSHINKITINNGC